MQQKRQNQAKILRLVRKLHRTTGIFLFLFFMIVAVTGLLLGWKKNSNNYLLHKTETGSSTDVKKWLSIAELNERALQYGKNLTEQSSLKVDRAEIRADKGIIKFTFKDTYVGLQLDASTGKLLATETRRADFIEDLHDGSFFDNYFKTPNENIKLIYTTIMGLSLLLFCITGFWLWFGPKYMRTKPV
jgi:uncharacterized iron-regulated membrane protein